MNFFVPASMGLQGLNMKTTAIKSAVLVAVLSAAAALTGCSVQTKWGARDVSFDFSDHAYYDKSFASSSMAAVHSVDGMLAQPAETTEPAPSSASADTSR